MEWSFVEELFYFPHGRDLTTMQILLYRFGVVPKICISNEHLGDADADAPRTILLSYQME